MSNYYACYINGLFYDIADIEYISKQIQNFILSCELDNGEDCIFDIQKVDISNEVEKDILHMLLKEGLKYEHSMKIIKISKDMIKATEKEL